MKTKIIKKNILAEEINKYPLTILAKKYKVSYVTFLAIIKNCFPDFKPKKGRPKKIEIEK